MGLAVLSFFVIMIDEVLAEERTIPRKTILGHINTATDKVRDKVNQLMNYVEFKIECHKVLKNLDTLANGGSQ